MKKKRYSAIIGRRDALIGWTVLIPIMLYFTIFALLPTMGVIVLSLFEWDGISNALFVGLDNFKELLLSPKYYQILWQTFIIGGVGLIVGFVVGFLIALLLNAQIKGRGVFRTIWYIPVLTSYAIIAQMFLIFLDPMNGTFNNILKSLGREPVIWQNSAFWMIFWITAFGVWKCAGGTAVLFLAGLQGVDRSYYEAAKIDGANYIQSTRYITWPLIRSMTIFVFITGVIGLFQVFDPIYKLTKGGPDNKTNVLVYQLYNDAFVNFRLGSGAAQSVLILLIVGTATYFTFRAQKRKEVY